MGLRKILNEEYVTFRTQKGLKDVELVLKCGRLIVHSGFLTSSIRDELDLNLQMNFQEFNQGASCDVWFSDPSCCLVNSLVSACMH